MSKNLDTMYRLIDSSRRKDFDAFLDCLTDDIEYYWHMGTKPLVGKEKMRKFLNNYTASYEQTQWEVKNYAENGDLLLAEGLEVIHDKKYDRMINQPFMQAFEFRDGKIAKLRDYYEASNLKPPVDATPKAS
ncbi:nuclear transport factor 2 family protein [Govanella unica]|uniref:Nuclear transport factor 2 family protein n=1 Tax=Govanella unica TaxID=2975056 RepID=A0A9X3TXI3_9PROT|nr:nuclear transport factor 2 family protein [Govania unica]MDA5193510.1 nuclear transport factor 2 family protein [Govania unica]